MKNFLAVYIGTSEGMNAWKALDEKTRKDREKAGMIAWSHWAKEHEKVIVETGSPLGKTKLASKKGISDTKNDLTAYTVVKAESHEEAAALFENHPHFTIFPGDSVQIMECLPLPKM